jgi:uncharacterized protein with NRDE domain
MCLALLALDAHPHYAIVIAANRDEYHQRPTAAAHWWSEGWLAGRDLAAGGSWLGITRAGRWALLTNVREPGNSNPAAASRGALVPQILARTDGPASSLAPVVAAAAARNGFNLLAGDQRSADFGSNRGPGIAGIDRGVFGLSNATLDVPWPKVKRTKSAFASWCTAGTDPLAPLFAILGDRTQAADDELPMTGVPVEWERMLSAPFIVGERYGTRASTVVTIARDGHARLVERSFDSEGRMSGENEFRFELA